MPCNILRLPLTAIDASHGEYQITTLPCADNLLVSIDALGLLNPPLLKASGDAYVIVSGFRRIEACRRLSLSEIETRVVEDGADPLHPVQMAIADNSFQRELNLIEQSRALNLLSTVIPDLAYLGKTAGWLGLPANLRMIERIMKLAAMPARIQEMIIEGSLSLGMIDEFERLQDGDARVVASLFDRLKPSLMKQRELLNAAREIALRDRIQIEAVIQSPDILAVLESDDYDRSEKNRLIRDILKRRRFPALSSAEGRLDHVWEQMRPGGKASLKPPPYFEGDVFSVTLQFQNNDELRKHRDLLDRMSKCPEFASFFKSSSGKSR